MPTRRRRDSHGHEPVAEAYVPMDRAIRTRNRTRRRGCLSCLGCGGILLVVLVVLSACGALNAPTGSSSPSAASAPASSATASASPSSTATGAASDDASAPPASTAAAAPSAAGSPGTALAMLATLEVKGRAPRTGYSRAQFGPAWADVDHNGCDTRNDVLRRDLTDVVLKAGTHGCKVSSGTLADPYTGTTVSFTAGRTTSEAVQIDHVVALSDAWQTGAQQLDADRREALANDPLNLLAVDGPSNTQKSDSDAASWLPAATGYRCQYVARQIEVKHDYGLWVTQSEHDAMARVLDSCRDQTPPRTSSAPLAQAPESSEAATPEAQATTAAAVPEPTTPTARSTRPAAAGQAPAQEGTGVVYGSCAEARAAGAAPLRAGSPGYSRKLDRDGDGVACESTR